MDISLRAERSATLAPHSRTIFSCAALIALSAFARDTAKAIPAFEFFTRSNANPIRQPIVTPVQLPAKPAEVVAPFAAAVKPTRLTPLNRIKSGLASWYGAVLQDHRTASGRRFNMYELTAAHRDLPFGSKVKVTDLRNRRSVIVTITDRGVLNADRVIDLSYEAARQLEMIKAGVDPVTIELIGSRSPVPAF